MSNAAQKQEDLIREPEVNLALGVEFGLKEDEYDHILEILGRTPTYTELGIFSVMWSEHCSYKSSRLHLKKFPTEAPWVIQGPGENAGVIDIGDGQAAVFKMESHNHPSFIEPYQGAATGVGGIMRDVFTMGARPVANINALRFGDPSHPKTRHLVSGVVAGIGGYGNCMGIPTVGGEVDFHEAYNGNILVNAMTVGIAEQDGIYYARGASVGQPIVYVGSKTGRDGIHGATMASASFDEEAEEKRPTVQVGDPFTEKLLLEACLELMQEDIIISIQDMGAAGLTSSSVEIAAKGQIGVYLNLDNVPQREELMSPYELMLSESQERMLIIVEPGREDEARAIFEKWDLDFAVIGETTDDEHLRIDMYGKSWCNIPVPPLVDDAPEYDRPQGAYPSAPAMDEAHAALPAGQDLGGVLKTLVSCPNMASKRWIWEQYDHLVGGETVQAPGQADAAIVKIENKDKALAISSDCTPRYCFATPFEGGKQTVAESYRNISATGATPLAVTNNLNFGNPERPEIMTQFVQCIEGMAEACRVLEYPVISGNVSLYNETNEQGILPTPVIGGVGVIDDWKRARGLGFKAEGESILLIGGAGAHLGQSLFLREIHGAETGEAPHVDLEKEKKHGAAIRELIAKDLVSACHDVSDGGVLLAVTEMAMASGVGAELEGALFGQTASYWFGEDQARYVVATKDAEAVKSYCDAQQIPAEIIGKTAGNVLKIGADQIISVEELKVGHESWLPEYMKGKE